MKALPFLEYYQEVASKGIDANGLVNRMNKYQVLVTKSITISNLKQLFNIIVETTSTDMKDGIHTTIYKLKIGDKSIKIKEVFDKVHTFSIGVNVDDFIKYCLEKNLELLFNEDVIHPHLNLKTITLEKE